MNCVEGQYRVNDYESEDVYDDVNIVEVKVMSLFEWSVENDIIEWILLYDRVQMNVEQWSVVVTLMMISMMR